ncbi:MAG: alpha/beta fold hydrolase [Lachnospiraceae bacterium]|nr:alpha/beta fold hydrolase [Lachnospiraceae bacterium]
MQKKEMCMKHHGREIYGMLYTPDGSTKCPMVIFSHGYNGSGKGAEGYAQYLAERGIGSYCYDFCGGSVTSRSSMPTTEMTLFTEKEDLLAVYDRISSLENTDKDSVFLFGESQGGLVSALAANELKGLIKGLILIFPALCIADNWNQKFENTEDIPEEEEFWGMKLGKKFFTSMRGFDTFANIREFGGRVLIIHGDQDEVVPVSYSQTAIGEYQNARLQVLIGEGHGFSKEGSQQAIQMTYDMIKECVRK